MRIGIRIVMINWVIWGALGLAIVLGFGRQRLPVLGMVALALVLMALGMAWAAEYLTLMGLTCSGVGLVLGWLLGRQSNNTNIPSNDSESHLRWRSFATVVGYTLLLFWSIVMFLHWLPGVFNQQVLDGVIAKPDSVPFNLYLNLDKPLVFFAWLLALPGILGQPRAFDYRKLLLILLATFSLLPLAAGLGALRPEIGLPTWWWLFALNNLLFTCVAEETLFRGVIPQTLAKRFGLITGLVLASVLFGVAHMGGGILLVVFATLAGLGYGAVYALTGRLWAAVLTHFLFNFIHLACFTYPVLLVQ